MTINGEGVPSTTTQIDVSDCERVFFAAGALSHLRELRHISVRGVNRLSLGVESWHWAAIDPGTYTPGLKITVSDSRVPEIPSHAISGRIDSILFNSSTIENIRPFAFSKLVGLKSIEFINCTIDNLETQAFKKFPVDSFVIKGTRFRTLPSRTVSDLEIRKILRIDDISADGIRSSAFLLSGSRNFHLENSRIETIEGDAFRVVAAGPVFIKNNVIQHLNAGAFAGFTVPGQLTAISGPMELHFDNNTVTSFQQGSLRVNQSSYSLILKDLKLNVLCECSRGTWGGLLQDDRSVLCAMESPFGPERVTYKYVYVYEEEMCSNKGHRWAIIAIVSVCSLIAVIAVVLAMVFIVKKGNRHGFSWVNRFKGQDSKVAVILPDGRTYRETELHVIVERADLLTTDL